MDPKTTESLSSCLLCGSPQLRTLDERSRMSGCSACGYVFDNPRPTLAALVEFYSQPSKYDHWMENEEARDALWRRRLRKMDGTRREGSLLDVGTGIGQFLHHARDVFTEVHGTEVSESAVRVARERYGLSITRAPVEEIEANAAWDNVTLFHVLEHVPDPRRTLEACWALLRPGGILVVAVPNDVQSLRQRAKGWLGRTPVGRARGWGRLGLAPIALDGSMQEIHLSHFTHRSLRTLLQYVGFEVVQESLDPHYAERGARRLRADAYYRSCLAAWKLFRVNLYDTIWMVGRKP